MIRYFRIFPYLIAFFVVPLSATKAQEEFNFGISGDIISWLEPADAKIAIRSIFGKSLIRKFDFQATVYDSNDAFLSEIENDRLKGFTIRTNEYFQLKKTKPEIKGASLAVLDRDSPLTTYVLLVRKTDDSSRLESFKGKTLVVSYGEGLLIDSMWLDSYLYEKELPVAEKFFGEIKHVRSASKAVVPLFFGKEDICLVRRHSWEVLTELNPQLGRSLEVLAVSPPLLEQVTCINTKLVNSTTFQQFQDSLVSMHETKAGKTLLNSTKVERIIRFEERYLDATRILVEKHKTLFPPK